MVKAAVKYPVMRPARPRISSTLPGFFFCGIMLDPMAKPSSNDTVPYSYELHQKRGVSQMVKRVTTFHKQLY